MIKHVKTLAACLPALLLAGCAASPTPAPTTTCYHVAMIAKSTSTEFLECGLCRGRGRRH